MVRRLAALLVCLLAFTAIGRAARITGSEAERARALLPLVTAQIEDSLGLVSWDGVSIELTTTRAAAPRPGSVPEWAAAFALPARGEVVIYTDRIGPYPHSSLRQLLTHELAHVAILQKSRGHDVPRWFDEGLSMSIAREAGIDDAFHLSLGMVFGPELPLATLDERFFGGHAEAQSAYAVAASLVRAIEAEHGHDVGRRVLARLATGEDFGQAILAATSRSLDAIERDWSERASFRYRWLPLVTSGTLLWIFIGLLALTAAFRHRRRQRERALAWDIEEAVAMARPDRTIH